MQPCKTGDQPYSDASPNGECSLAQLSNKCVRLSCPQYLAPHKIQQFITRDAI